MRIWRIAADTREYTADDLSGKGAESTGGRWNLEGSPVVYCAGSVALACLETVVHLDLAGLPLNRFLVAVDVPDKVWAAREQWLPDTLPVGWSAIPEGKVSVDAGERWLSARSSALLLVPSVLVPEEFNVLVNPRHPDARQLAATKLRPWLFDQRLRTWPAR
ncbi:RES family NAD+ phosphorylase [Variovorax sp. KK3]|uniref:RES family NAD+ phosphorylase n=1 Tax=Variovorax sp. KK3 TaxID=1855728 RepID=UPI00097C1D12|nr:RES family NAD+ phosphorylase [Variovorax sp. KK3]